jgi:uncharacterized membrane protein SirB2
MTDAAADRATARARAQATFARLHERQMKWVRTSGMSGLLVLLVLGMFVFPAAITNAAASRFAYDILLTLILLSGVVAVVEHRRLALVLAALSVVVLVGRWAEWTVPAHILPPLRDVSTLAALLVLAAAVGINVFASGRALADRIFGAIVLYLLLGLMWAMAYATVASTVPGAFHGPSPGALSDVFEWGYFSLVTLTTVGYGDVTPVHRVAQSLAALEALVGQLYPAIIIARLVSLPGPISERVAP